MFGSSSPTKGWEFFSLSPHPDPLCCPSSLLSTGYQGFFTWRLSSRGVKLTTHLHLMPSSRMQGLYHQSSNTPSWRSTQLKSQGQLYLNLYISHTNIILPSMPRSSEWPLPFRFPNQNTGRISQQSNTCSPPPPQAHLILPDFLITVTIFGVAYKL
jgi:hypothetical protein